MVLKACTPKMHRRACFQNKVTIPRQVRRTSKQSSQFLLVFFLGFLVCHSTARRIHTPFSSIGDAINSRETILAHSVPQERSQLQSTRMACLLTAEPSHSFSPIAESSLAPYISSTTPSPSRSPSSSARPPTTSSHTTNSHHRKTHSR
jgi:hypothetical protein